METKQQKGFTLIELSIVVVVIALIVAGVVVGQSLVEQAKLRHTLAQFKKLDLAFNGFHLTYNAFPGDMTNTSKFWPGLYDGNGDKSIYNVSSSAKDPNSAADTSEIAMATASIIEAGFFNEEYDIESNSTTNKVYLMSKDNINGYIYTSWTQKHFGIGKFPHVRHMCGFNTKNVIKFGKIYNHPNTHLSNASMTPKDVKKMDDKVDDGFPSSGFLTAGNGRETYTSANDSCLDEQNPFSHATTLYDLTNENEILCNVCYDLR